MAMSKAGLSTALQTAFAAGPFANPKDFCDAMADAIVSYIKANAEVTVSPGTLPTGFQVVVAGTPTPVTGAGKGTVG